MSSVIFWRSHQFQNSQAGRKICRFPKFLLGDLININISHAPRISSSFNQLSSIIESCELWTLLTIFVAQELWMELTESQELPWFWHLSLVFFGMKTKSFTGFYKAKQCWKIIFSTCNRKQFLSVLLFQSVFLNLLFWCFWLGLLETYLVIS